MPNRSEEQDPCDPKTSSGIFDPLIKESSSIVIEYEKRKKQRREDPLSVCRIMAVNSCPTAQDFKSKLKSLAWESLIHLRRKLRTLAPSQKPAFLESMIIKLDDLQSIIVEETYCFIDNDRVPGMAMGFKTFVHPILTGPPVPETVLFNPVIRKLASPFAMAWIEVIMETKASIDSMIGLPDADRLRMNAYSLTQINGLYKFQTTLSVSEISYFFKVLVDAGIIVIPEGQTEEFYKAIGCYYRSKKKQEDLSPWSIKNKFLSPDPAAVDSINDKFSGIMNNFEA
jgi:hypothetical protein